jgi:hypothetical protein
MERRTTMPRRRTPAGQIQFFAFRKLYPARPAETRRPGAGGAALLRGKQLLHEFLVVEDGAEALAAAGLRRCGRFEY